MGGQCVWGMCYLVGGEWKLAKFHNPVVCCYTASNFPGSSLLQIVCTLSLCRLTDLDP